MTKEYVLDYLRNNNGKAYALDVINFWPEQVDMYQFSLLIDEMVCSKLIDWVGTTYYLRSLPQKPIYTNYKGSL